MTARRDILGFKSKLQAFVFSVLLVAGLSITSLAQEERGQRQYQVSNLSSLGGTVSRGNSINDRGWIAGYSNLPGNQSRHATLWRDGSIFDLGTLGGPNSTVPWSGINNRGTVVGIAQTSQPDPLGERWSCSAFFSGPNSSGYTCLGFAWENGVMWSLPTLGGNNGFAAGINTNGEIVGWAENTVRDPTCTPPQVLQFRAVIWGPRIGKIQELLPLSGDTSTAATAINNRGQVVGISGTCDQAVGRRTARHAVVWNRDQITDIGNLGGDTWNTPMAINERGDVVGFASLPGSDPNSPVLHAFLWTRHGGIRDLGTLPGDSSSEAHDINNRGQVVGLSCGANGCRAFLWDDGAMRDLNTLKESGYAAHLEIAKDINDKGEITGRAIDSTTNHLYAYVAVPRNR